MKNLLFCLVVIICCSSGLQADQGIETPKVIAKYVVAPSGLNMRVSPHITAEIIGHIPYGEIIQIPENYDSCIVSEEIEYVNGNWVSIRFAGRTGYVFGGFLSPLATPQSDQLIHLEGQASIFSALENWLECSFAVKGDIEESFTEHTVSAVTRYRGGHEYKRVLYESGFEMEVRFADVDIMNVFHLIKGFYPEPEMKEVVDENTLFIRGKSGKIEKIRIFMGPYIEIKTLADGMVQLNIEEFIEGC